jgi:hypothetical protein
VVFVNEWFPNPVGPDASGEFVELYNSGSATASMTGWTLVTESKKKFLLNGLTISPGGYLVLRHAQTKLTLRNTAGGLALYAASGKLVDHGSFLGVAPEGESYSRVNYVPENVEHFAFVAPTPGRPNKTISTSLTVHAYPKGAPLNTPLNGGGFFAIMMGTSALLAGLILHVIQSHDDLSQLFFGGDKEVW